MVERRERTGYAVMADLRLGDEADFAVNELISGIGHGGGRQFNKGLGLGV